MDELIIERTNQVLDNWELDNMYSSEAAFGIFHESFNPLRLHVDSGKDKNSILYKQILIILWGTGETFIHCSSKIKKTKIGLTIFFKKLVSQ